MSPPPTRPRTDIAVRDSLLTQLEEFERENHRRDAQRLELLSRLLRAAITETGPSDTLEYRSLRLELATLLRQSEHAAERLLDMAWTVTEQYPRAQAALRDGRISLAHVRVIVDAGHTLTTGHPDVDDAKRASYEEEVLPFAAEETPNRLRPIARRLVAVHAGSSLTDQHAQALTRRRVWVQDADDGMADLFAHLPAEEAYAIHDRLTRIAAEVTATEQATASAEPAAAADAVAQTAPAAPAEPADDVAQAPPAPRRTRDEVRADVFCDLLLERPGTSRDVAERVRAQVQLVVPGEAVGLPGAGGVAELIGHGPIDPGTASRIAGTAEVWERVAVTDAGEVLSVDRYRPSPQMRRLLAARDLHCRAPGCRVPASRCDLDHTVDAALGGPTRTDNLAHLCRGHHTLKHHTEWTVAQEPGGVVRWTSPTGRETVDKPPSRVRFRPVDPHRRAA